MSVKESVLNALEQNRGKYVSGEKLSEDLDVSRAAVWKAIKTLRGEGYRIEAVTNRGYFLAEEDEGTGEEDIRRYLPSRYKGNDIHVYDLVDSTNMKAREMTQSHGVLVFSRQQTAGRGRLGRSFFSPKNGLYMSLIIRPGFDLSRSLLVTIAAASAVAEAIDSVCAQGEETRIKWVNDIYIGDKKVCGILTEGITDFESGNIESLIIGIGINTRTEDFPDDLKDIAGAVEGEWSRPKLIAEIMTRVLDYTEKIDEGSFMESYRKKDMLTGRQVRVFKGAYRRDPGKEIGGVSATACGIDDGGGLMVVYEDGSEETLTTGEVTVRAKDI